MLVLTRKPQERIQIGENITITIVRIKGRAVRVGIEAPDSVRIVRGELSAEHDSPTEPGRTADDSEANLSAEQVPAAQRGLRRPSEGRAQQPRQRVAGASHVLEAHIGLRRARRGATVSCVTTVLSATA